MQFKLFAANLTLVLILFDCGVSVDGVAGDAATAKSSDYDQDDQLHGSGNGAGCSTVSSGS